MGKKAISPWLDFYATPNRRVIINPYRYAPGGGGGIAITGQSLGTLANSQNWYAGFRFTVGASNITVTHLGRWIVSGNSQNKALLLVPGAGGSPLAFVSLNRSGQPAAAYAYVAISSVVLTAGQSYLVASEETSGGDQWYSDDTTVVSDTDITVTDSIWSTGGAWTPNATGAFSYGPVNFLYTRP